MKPNTKVTQRKISAQGLYSSMKTASRKVEVVDRAGSDRMIKQLFRK